MDSEYGDAFRDLFNSSVDAQRIDEDPLTWSASVVGRRRLLMARWSESHPAPADR